MLQSVSLAFRQTSCHSVTMFETGQLYADPLPVSMIEELSAVSSLCWEVSVMKKMMKLLSIPVVFIVTTINLFAAVIGAILFKLLSLFVGLVAVCTIWAWLIGDKMTLLFAGITLGACALMVIGMLLSDESVSIITRFSRRAKQKDN